MLAQAGQLAASVGAGAASILAATISELCVGKTREMAQLSDPDRTIDEHLESIRGKTASTTNRHRRPSCCQCWRPPLVQDVRFECRAGSGASRQARWP